MAKKPYVPDFPGIRLDTPDPRDYREQEISALKRASVQDIVGTHGKEYQSSDLVGDYQDGQPECVLQAYSFLYRQLYKKEYGEDIDMSECFAYAMAEQDEPGPPDKGTYSRLGAKVFQKYGVCEAKYYQPDRGIDFDEYINPHNIPQEATNNARKHRVEAYARVDGLGWGGVTLEGILNAIVKYGGCEIALRGTRKDWLQEDGVIHAPTSEDYFYHGVSLNGWKIEKGWKDNPEEKILPRGLNWWDKDGEGQLKYAQGSFYFRPSEYLDHINGAFILTGLADTGGELKGWVAGAWLKRANRFSPGEKVVSEENLNVRNLPTTVSSDVLGTIKKGSTIEIEGHKLNGNRYGDYKWWRVKVGRDLLK